MSKLVYSFDEGKTQSKEILGGKGYNLAEMKSLGLPVPDGFTITTTACMNYLNEGEVVTPSLKEEIENAVKDFEERAKKAFNSEDSLLLVSVRSGAKFSMPGMMDTILNLGLNDKNVETLAEKTGDRRFAYDCYRRLLQMFGEVVYKIPMVAFNSYFDRYKEKHNYELDTDIPAEGLEHIVNYFKELYLSEAGKPFPQEPEVQLIESVEAVFKSWNNDRARVYRELNDIPHDIGTGVTVQEMVFGNSGEHSGTGVAFTRNPATGENKLYGEYLINAQGEDVVAGIRTPKEISTLKEKAKDLYDEFVDITKKLEAHYKDMQDIEFTIEDGKLFILQTRNGKRTAKAAVEIATDLVEEGLIKKEEAIMMIEPKSLDQLLHPSFNEASLESAELITKAGLPASPGAASGKIVFSAEEAKHSAENGEKVILVRPETSPEDIEGMIAAEAIVTTHGGMTSHAAVVARGMGKCCVTGASDLKIDGETRTVTYPGGEIKEGQVISVDGATGKLYLGEVETTANEQSEAFTRLMKWAEEISDMAVRMNAETDDEITAGFDFGAVGIGLVRTEHMFFGEERLVQMRKFIIAETKEERVDALNKILAYQKEDFEKIFRQAGDRPVIVRLLDPPLHEFLPQTEKETKEVAETLDITPEFLNRRIRELSEVNPMLGHRGCRLSITYPELTKMQTEAMIDALIKVKEDGIESNLEIMVPLISTFEEFKTLKDVIETSAKQLIEVSGQTVNYSIGTMIEIPRACFIADKIAKECDFFSFGTNDLTQLTFGFSRDDVGKFIGEYEEKGILENDPFQTIDEAVGELVKMAVEKARSVDPNYKLGVCGELGGDPRSIEFFNEIGMSYVSCSPFRVPGAILASAQSKVKQDV